MYVMPRNMQHRRRRVEELAERAPALIDLPFSLQSIPLLGPILTPLIGGPPPATTTPSTPSTPPSEPTTTTQAAPPPQTPTTTQPSNPQSPTTSPNGSPATGETGDGNGNGSTSSNGSNPEPSGSAPSSPSESNPSGSTPSSGSSPSDNSSVPGIPTRPGSPVITISGDGQAFLSSSQTSSPGQETGGNSSPNGATQVSIPAYSGSVSATMTGSPTGATTGSTNINVDPGDPAQAGSTHHGLSGGVLAAIVIVCVLLGFVLLLCCMRRRAIAARVRRRREWFAGGATQDMGYADRDSASARSSFATNYDQGQVASSLPAFEFPTLQTARAVQQMWPSDLSGSIVAVPPVSHAVESSSSPTIRVTADRSSIHSTSSGSPSRPSSQVSLPYLIVPPPAAEASPNLSPISVRPFSPTESWSFPKPPKDDGSVRRASQIRGGSVTNSSQSHGSFPAENPQNPPAAAENPFAEPENPFADPASVAWPESPTVPSFSAVDTVRRPFVPSMPDEMAVNVGDQVRVVHGFDDGWAVVQNVGTGAQGLVPFDRMREDEKEVPAPAFLARKRVSSYVRPRDSALTRASVVSGTSTIGAAI